MSEHSNHPVHTEPVVGHAGTNFEGSDAKVGIIIGSLLVIVVTLVVSFILGVPILRLLNDANPRGQLPSPIAPARVVPSAPVLQVHPWEVFPDLVAAQNKQLHSAGTDASGKPHIPIEQAIDRVAGKLNVRPNAPEGYTIPGGQGREFSRSLDAMPPAYHTQAGPTIQGEIRKNAQ